jgi:enoyl-CoA hydratase/carnithine racemase
MTSFDDYATKYEMISMRREDGILEMRFHTEGGPLRWGMVPHRELEDAFLQVGRDLENEIVILTGTGAEFSGPTVKAGEHGLQKGEPITAADWDLIYREGKRLLWNLLDIQVPMIAAINGPATRHSEIPLLCDIVLASDTAAFQDSAHFQGGLVPGDGVHAVYPMLMGHNRGRYFLLTGQVINADQALALGLVSEVMPGTDLLPRAWALARQLKLQSAMTRRYTRVLFARRLKKELDDLLEYGLVLEGMAVIDKTAGSGATRISERGQY